MNRYSDISVEWYTDFTGDSSWAFRFRDLAKDNKIFWTGAGFTVAEVRQAARELFGDELAATISYPEE